MAKKRHPNSHGMTVKQVNAARQSFNDALGSVFDGNQSALARTLKVKPQAVQLWASSGVIPPARVIKVCEALKGEVSPHQLRPDLYPVPEEVA